MKKVLYILFLLYCFIGTPSRAQFQSQIVQQGRRALKGASFGLKNKHVVTETQIGAGRIVTPIIRSNILSGINPKSISREVLNPVWPTVTTYTDVYKSGFQRFQIDRTRDLDIRGLTTNQDLYVPTYIDARNRGFIPEKHISSPSSTEPNLSVPKLNLDKIQMKVMMKQNRLNKNEMKADEFIIIGLLIYHNEYGECYITDYAA